MTQAKDPNIARIETDLKKYTDTSDEPISVAGKVTTPNKLNGPTKKKEK